MDEVKKMTLREYMEKNSMTNSQMARKIGCADMTIVRWKRGKTHMHPYFFRKLEKLGIVL